MHRVVLTRVVPIQRDRLIGDDARRAISGGRIHPMSIEVGFGASHEKGPDLVQPIQAAEIDIPTVHDIDGAGLGHEHIERMHVVPLSLGNMDETRDVAAQI
jgi:hypothetical protein